MVLILLKSFEYLQFFRLILEIIIEGKLNKRFTYGLREKGKVRFCMYVIIASTTKFLYTKTRIFSNRSIWYRCYTNGLAVRTDRKDYLVHQGFLLRQWTIPVNTFLIDYTLCSTFEFPLWLNTSYQTDIYTYTTPPSNLMSHTQKMYSINREWLTHHKYVCGYSLFLPILTVL